MYSSNLIEHGDITRIHYEYNQKIGVIMNYRLHFYKTEYLNMNMFNLMCTLQSDNVQLRLNIEYNLLQIKYLLSVKYLVCNQINKCPM